MVYQPSPHIAKLNLDDNLPRYIMMRDISVIAETESIISDSASAPLYELPATYEAVFHGPVYRKPYSAVPMNRSPHVHLEIKRRGSSFDDAIEALTKLLAEQGIEVI